MEYPISAKLLDSTSTMSLALHFRFITADDYSSSVSVSVRLLARVLCSVRNLLMATGPLMIRMEKLLYTQHLGGKIEAGWRDSVQNCRCWPQQVPVHLVDLDRIFVVVVSGRLAHAAAELCAALSRSHTYPFLFGLAVDSANSYQGAMYLSAHCTPIGVLHNNATLEVDFGAIDYCPEIIRMLERIKMNGVPSAAAIAEVGRLLE